MPGAIGKESSNVTPWRSDAGLRPAPLLGAQDGLLGLQGPLRGFCLGPMIWKYELLIRNVGVLVRPLFFPSLEPDVELEGLSARPGKGSFSGLGRPWLLG